VVLAICHQPLGSIAKKTYLKGYLGIACNSTGLTQTVPDSLRVAASAVTIER
jgi:hypothetical protein